MSIYLTRLLPPEIVEIIKTHASSSCLACHACSRCVLRERHDLFFEKSTPVRWAVEGHLLVSRDATGKVVSFRSPIQRNMLHSCSVRFDPEHSPAQCAYDPDVIRVSNSVYPNRKVVLEQVCDYFLIDEQVVCKPCRDCGAHRVG